MTDKVKMTVNSAEELLKDALKGAAKPTVLIIVGWESSKDATACVMHVSGHPDVLDMMVRGASDQNAVLEFAVCNAAFGRISSHNRMQ